MPEEGVEWQEKSKILSFEEINHLVKLLVSVGVTNIRLTGGEPSIREDYLELIRMLKSDNPSITLSMTTNAIKLKNDAQALKESGMDRLNISLDTLSHIKFNDITRRDVFSKVIEGIEKAVEVGFKEIKINAVAIKDFNTTEDELRKFLDLATKFNIEIRFIELMPFTGMGWSNDKFISSEDLRNSISKISEITPLPLKDPSQTSRTWDIKNQNGRVGFISSVSESFCSTCDRIRITAEGNLRPCLHNNLEYPLREMIRCGKSDEEILQVIKKGLAEKWKEHPDFLSLTYLPPMDDREMIRIGG